MNKLESIIASAQEPVTKTGILWLNTAENKMFYWGPSGWTEASEGLDLSSVLGKPNGVAGLDSSGKIPSEQLPSYVDDVVEFDSKNNFPIIGEEGKIYVDKSDNSTYRWSGSTYINISNPLSAEEQNVLNSACELGLIVANRSSEWDFFGFDSYHDAYDNPTGGIALHYTYYDPVSKQFIGGQSRLPPAASGRRDGALSGADKAKLDSINTDMLTTLTEEYIQEHRILKGTLLPIKIDVSLYPGDMFVPMTQDEIDNWSIRINGVTYKPEHPLEGFEIQLKKDLILTDSSPFMATVGCFSRLILPKCTAINANWCFAFQKHLRYLDVSGVKWVGNAVDPLGGLTHEEFDNVYIREPAGGPDTSEVTWAYIQLLGKKFRDLTLEDIYSHDWFNLTSTDGGPFQNWDWGGELDCSKIYMPKCRNYKGAFNQLYGLNSIVDVSKFPFAGIDNAYGMFSTSGDDNIKGLEDWDFSVVTSCHGMFMKTKISRVDMAKWDTRNVTNINRMFCDTDCTPINFNIPDWSNVVDGSCVFYSCRGLTDTVDLSGTTFPKMTMASNWFEGCTQVTTLHFGDSCSMESVNDKKFEYQGEYWWGSTFNGLRKLVTVTGNLIWSPYSDLKIESPVITMESLDVFIRALPQVDTVRRFMVKTATLNAMSDEQKATVASKGWTLSTI